MLNYVGVVGHKSRPPWKQATDAINVPDRFLLKNKPLEFQPAMLFRYACFLCTLLIVPVVATAERPGKSASADWRELPGVDGKQHSLPELRDYEVVVVAITCNHCPIAIEYYDRMNQFVDETVQAGNKVKLVAISVSDMEADGLPRMKQVAKRRGFKFDYLLDRSQNVARMLRATNTPEFFVLNREREVVYQGAWDDDVNASKVKQSYVRDAVDSVLAGRTVHTKKTKAKGCLIDYRDEGAKP